MTARIMALGVGLTGCVAIQIDGRLHGIHIGGLLSQGKVEEESYGPGETVRRAGSGGLDSGRLASAASYPSRTRGVSGLATAPPAFLHCLTDPSQAKTRTRLGSHSTCGHEESEQSAGAGLVA